MSMRCPLPIQNVEFQLAKPLDSPEYAMRKLIIMSNLQDSTGSAIDNRLDCNDWASKLGASQCGPTPHISTRLMLLQRSLLPPPLDPAAAATTPGFCRCFRGPSARAQVNG